MRKNEVVNVRSGDPGVYELSFLAPQAVPFMLPHFTEVTEKSSDQCFWSYYADKSRESSELCLFQCWAVSAWKQQMYIFHHPSLPKAWKEGNRLSCISFLAFLNLEVCSNFFRSRLRVRQQRFGHHDGLFVFTSCFPYLLFLCRWERWLRFQRSVTLCRFPLCNTYTSFRF